MNKRLDNIIRFINKPNRWGMIFLTMVPIYALVYRFLIPSHIDFGIIGKSFLSCLYFSASAISTLGIGDIAPLDTFASTIIASECLLGVIVIGLFLNSLSYKQNKDLTDEDNYYDSLSEYNYEKNKALQFNRIIQIAIEHYKHAMFSLQKKPANEPVQIEYLTEIFKPPVDTKEFQFPYANIYYFYKYQDGLVRDVRELIKEVNLEYWPKLEETCMQFISIITKYDNREFFLSIEMNSPEATRLNEYLMFPERFSKEIEELKRNDLQPFVQLVKVINISLDFSTRFSQMMVDVKKIPAEKFIRQD